MGCDSSIMDGNQPQPYKPNLNNHSNQPQNQNIFPQQQLNNSNVSQQNLQPQFQNYGNQHSANNNVQQQSNAIYSQPPIQNGMQNQNAQYYGNQPVQNYGSQPVQNYGNQPVQVYGNQPNQNYGNHQVQQNGNIQFSTNQYQPMQTNNNQLFQNNLAQPQANMMPVQNSSKASDKLIPVIKAQKIQAKIIKEKQNQSKGWYQTLVQPQSRKDQDRVTGKRGTMQLYTNSKDDYITHHLKNQISLSRYSGAQQIRRRQIINHYRFQVFFNHGYGQKSKGISQFAMKAYLQRVLLDVFVDADQEFFQENKSIDEVRHKIAQRYLFQLYQLKQFADASLGKFSLIVPTSQIPLSSTSVASDSALYPALKFLKQKYPQVADKTTIKFPDVKQIKNDVNLLGNFASKCYSTPNLINIQTLFDDLKFLIDRSIEQFADFQSDMKAILGDDVLTDSKVKKINKDGKQQYTASPVRRVFIKWTQTIIERIPNVILTEAFLDFIKSKSKMADNFYFKSTTQPATHSLVIQYLSNLLESAKYQISTLAQKKQFGFYIYDLLRCKCKRNTGEEVVKVLQKMQSTTMTPSGKKFQVVRIKDRFKTPNRDLMVNFRYGDVIVGEAQLCIDTSDVSQKTKKTNKFNHYIYELERGLFGPTFQLIMQYQDFQRKDISANLQAQGLVKQRKVKQPLNFLKKADRKCFNGHEMIELQGNYFISDDVGNFQQNCDMQCDYCLTSTNSKISYHYCYFCSIMFCKNCVENYKKQNIKEIQLLCNRDQMIVKLSTEAELQKYCASVHAPIVIFYLTEGSANVIFKDCLVYYMCVYKMQKKNFPKIAFFNCDSFQTTNILAHYDIKTFPTTILMANNMTPQIVLIGASFSQIQGLFQAQNLMLKGHQKALPLKCFCEMPMSQIENENEQQFMCTYCGNVDKTQSIFDTLIGEDRTKLFMCENQHARCYTCSYLGVSQPVKFKDYLGKSYLSNFRLTPTPVNCQKGHPMNYSLINNKRSMQFTCFKCLKKFLFNDQFGMGSCQQCQVYTCCQCHGIRQPTLSDSKGELISHTVQSTAEEGQKCICGRLFKKVYNTRIYEKQQQEQQKDELTTLLNSVFVQKKHNWQCILCEGVKSDGQLHLACFRCPRLQKRNIQICIQCSVGSDLLNKQLQPRIFQIQGDLVCSLNHKVVRTRINYDQASMTYDCCKCKKTYYGHTERYYCKTCKSNTCFQCSKKALKNIKPPKCLRKCDQNHSLVTRQKPLQLRFCDGCKTVIRKIHFVCVQACNFELCLSCAATAPGVNTVKMKHIEDEKVNKQMQKYYQNNENYQRESDDDVNNLANQAGQFLDDLFG